MISSELLSEFQKIQSHKTPVLYAWNHALDYLKFPKHSAWREFGEKFAKSHPDLTYSPNAYHNQIHSAEAIFSAAIFAKEEFNSKELDKYAPYLLFGMMCHDIEHNGGHNKQPYELEKLAVQSMKEHLNQKEMKTFWENNLQEDYGKLSHFQRRIARLILGTEFKVGVQANLKAYESNDKDNPFVRLNTLANEADIFVSVLQLYGSEKGFLLAEEQNMPSLATEQGRMFFLENLAKYTSDASKKLGIQEHISEQVKTSKIKNNIQQIRSNCSSKSSDNRPVI